MKTVILAGGMGTRLIEETCNLPKPLVTVGGMPILWHIMKMYSYYGYNEFIVCCGYKGYLIKEYFANYSLHMSNVTFDMQNHKMEIHHNYSEPWKVTVVDTGLATMTGGRIKKVLDYIDGEHFFMTYGDCIGDINIKALHEFAVASGKKACVTAVQPPGRYGILKINGGGKVLKFEEKPSGDGNWINGGFFVLKKDVGDYIEDDNSVWEQAPMLQLCSEKELVAFKHEGFWRPMDSLRDKQVLDQIWEENKAPWKYWN
ncbi:MAG: glucose-1-phosphate cytidylyltransferase [Lentisphaerae bacterium GWF2_52_8]|nr:MAG: glucose-1-phosphate cytidylyltransferase [Lentisphaerae bacterium GWF2_52_8]